MIIFLEKVFYHWNQRFIRISISNLLFVFHFWLRLFFNIKQRLLLLLNNWCRLRNLNHSSFLRFVFNGVHNWLLLVLACWLFVVVHIELKFHKDFDVVFVAIVFVYQWLPNSLSYVHKPVSNLHSCELGLQDKLLFIFAPQKWMLSVLNKPCLQDASLPLHKRVFLVVCLLIVLILWIKWVLKLLIIRWILHQFALLKHFQIKLVNFIWHFFSYLVLFFHLFDMSFFQVIRPLYWKRI